MLQTSRNVLNISMLRQVMAGRVAAHLLVTDLLDTAAWEHVYERLRCRIRGCIAMKVY